MLDNVHTVHTFVNPGCAQRGLERRITGVHHAHMARKTRKGIAKQPMWRRTFLKEWRKACGLTLEKVAPEMGLKHSQLSRIENGLQPYNQLVLEVAARLYDTTTWDLLNRRPPPPGKPDEDVMAALATLDPEQHPAAARVIRALKP